MTPTWIRDVLLWPRDDKGQLKLAGGQGEVMSRRAQHREYLFLNGVVGLGKAFDALAARLFAEEEQRAARARQRPAPPRHPGADPAAG